MLLRILEEEILEMLFPKIYKTLSMVFGDMDEFKVILTLFKHPNKSFSLRELSQISGINYKNFTYRKFFQEKRERIKQGKMRLYLEKLADRNLLIKKKHGRRISFQVNPESVYSEILKRIMTSVD